MTASFNKYLTAFAATAVLALGLMAVPDGNLGTQRSGGARAETPTSSGDILQSIGSAAERLSQAGAPAGGRGEQLAALKLDGGTLGEAASKAVSRWPAARKADPAWEWVRVLVFFVQSALVAQGYDPGKPDGLMGPKTMLALIAWSAVSGPLWDGDDEMSYLWGLGDNVAHLLHGTLESKGLSPGLKDRFLGPESVTALDRWDGTFRSAAMLMSINENLGTHIVMKDFGQGPSPDTEETGSQSSAGRTSIGSTGTGPSEHDCLKGSWQEDSSPYCYDYGHLKGTCVWAWNAHNTCGFKVVVYFLGNFGPHPSPSEERDWRMKVWQKEYMEIGENWAVSRPTGSKGRWDLPEGVRLDLSYCVNRYDAHIGRGERLWDWYRNEQDVGAVNTECLSDE